MIILSDKYNLVCLLSVHLASCHFANLALGQCKSSTEMYFNSELAFHFRGTDTIARANTCLSNCFHYTKQEFSLS